MVAAATATATGGAGPLLEASGLVRRYGGRTVLEVDALQLYPGEVLAVLGPNGSGKSTLFRLLLLLEDADAGTIKLGGVEVRRNDARARRQMAGVFQQPYLFRGTVKGNVEYGVRVSRGNAAGRVDAILGELGLTELANRNVRGLSGGEAQRVALARTLVLQPDVLLLDEPTSNLDVTLQRQFREDLRRVSRAHARSVVLITHDPVDAFALADRIAVLQQGRIVQVGRPDTLVVAPATPFIAAFTGAELLLDGAVEAMEEGLMQVRIAPDIRVWAATEHSLPLASKVHVSYRPEDVVLSLGDKPFESSARNVFPLRVATVTPAGGLVRVGLEGAMRLAAIVTRMSVEEMKLGPGIAVNAHLKAAALRVFAAES